MSSPTTSPICATPTRWSSRPINWTSRAHSLSAGTPAGKAFVDRQLAAGAIELRDMIYTAWKKSAEPVPAYQGKLKRKRCSELQVRRNDGVLVPPHASVHPLQQRSDRHRQQRRGNQCNRRPQHKRVPHPHPESRVRGSGAVRAACRNRRGASGIAAVWNTRDPSRMNGTTSASSSGNIAWLAICDATTFSRKRNVTARQRSVVLPMHGVDSDQRSGGDAPCQPARRRPHAQQRQNRQHAAAIDPVVVRRRNGVGHADRINCAHGLRMKGRL